MSNKAISILVIVVIVIVGFFLFMGKSSAPTENEINNIGSGMPVPTEEGSGASEKVVEFTVEGSPFKFTPSTLKVAKGDTVRITFKNLQGTHDFKLDEFSVATKILAAGGSETVEFVASKSGSFEYYCSVGTHRQMGMVGTLVVE